MSDWMDFSESEIDWRTARARERVQGDLLRQFDEAARRLALGPDGRAWEDYGKRWAQMQRGR